MESIFTLKWEIDAIQNIMHVISEIYSNNHLKEIRVNFWWDC